VVESRWKCVNVFKMKEKENKKTTNAADFLKWLRTSKIQNKGSKWFLSSDPNEKYTDQEICDIYIKENKL